MKDTCAVCKFFSEKDYLGQIYDGSHEYQGFCRRYPPSIPLEKEYQIDKGNCIFMTAYPAVFEFLWCGEFQPK